MGVESICYYLILRGCLQDITATVKIMTLRRHRIIRNIKTDTKEDTMAAHEFMKFKNWVVCGTISRPDKYAYRILTALKKQGYNAEGYHPIPEVDPAAYHDFKDLPVVRDVLDLVISPTLGLDVVKAAYGAGIKRVMAQPGARSEAIQQWCTDHKMEYVEACALVELNNLDQ